MKRSVLIAKPAIPLLLLGLLFVLPPTPAPAFSPKPTEPTYSTELKASLERAEASVGTSLSPHTLTDQDGVRFTLDEYFAAGKPLLINYIFTTCMHVCPVITRAFIDAAEESRAELGDGFNVLIIGFDAERDTPEKLKEYAKRFTGDTDRYRFASSDAETITGLTSETGFFFTKREDGGFDHLDMATLVTSEGKVHGHVYGLRSQGSRVVLRLKELLLGQKAPPRPLTVIEKIKFLCSKYDPYTGTYTVDYYVYLGSFLQLLVMGAIVYAVWGERIMGFLRRVRKRGTPDA